jgi:hypothetical protein
MHKLLTGFVLLGLVAPVTYAHGDPINPYNGTYYVDFSISGLLDTPQGETSDVATMAGRSYFTGNGYYVVASSTTLTISGIPTFSGTYSSSDPLFFGSLAPFISITGQGIVYNFDDVADYDPYGAQGFELHFSLNGSDFYGFDDNSTEYYFSGTTMTTTEYGILPYVDEPTSFAVFAAGLSGFSFILFRRIRPIF